MGWEMPYVLIEAIPMLVAFVVFFWILSFASSRDKNDLDIFGNRNLDCGALVFALIIAVPAGVFTFIILWFLLSMIFL